MTDDLKDWMALTTAEKGILGDIAAQIERARAATTGQTAAGLLQDAEDRLRDISRRQFWSLR